MLWRLLFIFSTLAVLINCAAAQLLAISRLRKLGETHQSVDDVLRKLLQQLGRDDITIQYSKAFWIASSQFHPTRLVLPIHYQQSRHASCIGHSLLRLGMLFMHSKHPNPVEWRLKMIQLGYMMPAFVIMGAVFSSLIGRLPVMISLCAVSGSLLIACVSLWLSIGVEQEAARLMVKLVKKYRLLVRVSDEEEVIEGIQAKPWVNLIPGILLKFIWAEPTTNKQAQKQ